MSSVSKAYPPASADTRSTPAAGADERGAHETEIAAHSARQAGSANLPARRDWLAEALRCARLDAGKR